ncbi:NTP transferase domain-containing protein [Candidatus Peregrinibacteria bacterium]|nr:NTP transferase domain-containing protein [Candidatus Peregrinibacteria bacterium]
MKGVLICGGSGTRLKPLTDITNKSLLPVYDKPLLLYPLQTLLDAGIRKIMVVSGPEHVDQMAGFLGSGTRFGCAFSYRVQDDPKGIAQALGMAEEFADGDNVCALLGDNIYLDPMRQAIASFESGGHVFLKEVSDPERFGVAQVQGTRITSIAEKPAHPTSNLAITGCYIYDHRCFEVIRHMQPSPRGELEITDVSRWYMEQKELSYTILKDEWIDAGTFESLHQAAVIIRSRKLAHTVQQFLPNQTVPQKASPPVQVAPALHGR